MTELITIKHSSVPELPALIPAAGDRAASRFLEFFTVNIRNKNTRAAYGSFRAIGLTDYLENGGDINIAKRMAGHANIKITELYDLRGDDVSFSEIE
jgi:hypothetical protein